MFASVFSASSLAQAGQHAHSPHHPVLRAVGDSGHLYHHEEVGGVPRGGQDALSVSGAVHGALVVLVLPHGGDLGGTKPDDRSGHKQDLRGGGEGGRE